ncbi:MAG: radical SAM protein [Kiritimatiellae bacterium]|jgi:radical SAM protein with 4Fe4S-binding SPASM domain|nr:radical SAM protein [Kiritimatiellia bacterium]
MLSIETDSSIFEIEFHHLQLNLTARCNMACEYCRADCQDITDLHIDDIKRLLSFSNEHTVGNARYLISGGEPFLYPQFREFFKLLRRYAINERFVTITTNGTFVTDAELDFLDSLRYGDLRISVSLDSINANRHNAIRGTPNAFDDAISAIQTIANRKGIQCLVRATIQRDQLHEIPDMCSALEQYGVDEFSISSIIPSGRARNAASLWFDADSKKQMIEIGTKLSSQYSSMRIEVNDPLRYANKPSDGCEYTFGGCIAGVGGFSIEPNGNMFPCALMRNQTIMNIIGKNADQMGSEFASSNFIHNLLERNLLGKCSTCRSKFACGGCRARAEALNGSYLETDPECWF